MLKSFIVEDDYGDSRLDKWFKQNVISLPHSLIEKIIRQNKVKAVSYTHLTLPTKA